MAVAPGFINMLSWANESLIQDGRSQGDIRQGVTLEVMGEGSSMGPLNDAMRKEMIEEEGDIKYDVPWTTLGQYLDHLVKKGISPNVASFVGATTLRVHEIGYADRPPTPEELLRMQALARQAMEEGRARHRLVADLRARVLREDRRARRAVEGGRPTAACTSRTCGAKARGCSRRSTS